MSTRRYIRFLVAAISVALLSPLLEVGSPLDPAGAATDPPANTITTLAGNGTDGGAGDCLPVKFDDPGGVALDADGNLYVADYGNNRVRRVTPDGQVTTVAGNGSLGYSGDNGPALDATLGRPADVEVDAAGNLYIAEALNARIRRVGTDGVITTVAGGNGFPGFSGDGGPATAAQLNSPFGVGIDGAGNLYIADSANHRIRRVDAGTNTITTVAGTGTPAYGGDGGPATAATLNLPVRLDVDGGHLYVSDTNNFAVRRIDGGNGVITTVAGNGTIGFSGDGGPATAAQLRSVTGIAVDDGIIHLADSNNQRIRMVDALGTITTIAGNGVLGNGADDVPALNTAFNNPTALARNADTGELYIVDNGNNRIRRLEGTTMRAVAGDPAGGAGFGDCVAATSAELSLPAGLAYDGTVVPDLYISELTGHRIRRFESDSATMSTFAGTGAPGFSGDGGPATSAQLNEPLGLVTDGNDIYVADSANHRVRKIDRLTGIITTVAGTGVAGTSGDGGPATSAQLSRPSGLARDPLGNLFIAEYDSGVVRRIDATTDVITTVAGTGTPGFSGDGGPATAAQLDGPVALVATGISLAPQPGVLMVLYIADQLNNRVRRVDLGTGEITTVAGTGTDGYAGDNGPAVDAELDQPSGLAVDYYSNDLFVADARNHAIRRVTLAGEITTVAGTGVAGFSGDGGPATSAQIRRPMGITNQQDGDLLVADSVNHRVRHVTPGGPYGYLRVTTTPALPTEIIVDGISRDSWGLNWVEFPIGAHEVCFGAISGWTRPACQEVIVQAGQTTEVVGAYTQRGYLQVATSPALPATIVVNNALRDDWGVWMDFTAGDYEVCFGKVADWDPPPCQDVTVTPGATTPVTGTYISNPGAPGPGAPFGNLRVTTEPAVSSRILVDGIPRNAWGLSWLKLAAGDHEICFGEVLHTTTPDCHVVTILEGATTTWVGSFEPKGFLQVSTNPAVPATIFVDGERANAWGVWNALPPGSYEVCFGDVPGLVTPPCEIASVSPYVTTSVTGSYTAP